MPTQPTFFIPHGGGPCFFMDWDPPDAWDKMRAFLEGLIPSLDEPPRAVLVVSAHWEGDRVPVSNKPAPGLYYDYYGFPPHTYQLDWPARGDAALGARVAGLIRDAGLDVALDDTRDYDHGVFVPFKVAMPTPDVPVVAMGLRSDLDPDHHLAVGRALRPLRDEGVLIVGSGLSFHNLSAMRGGGAGADASATFDMWLTGVVEGDPDARDAALANWADAPAARAAHPREEHLAPIWVAAGAAQGEPATRVYADHVMGVDVSAYRFG